ncbi:signal transduction histidine kinase [Brevundimonas bullata]|uniref:Signal transduction histidine kinase n=1 Tax=Brevundimonas bullata TaxID=13160 RepID=A0A7W7ILN9_9CAUL|nr:hypothetical protein [Brevundimonas bullata]MBB4796408.1 signal transduction histidine kinase [Brevundimonas bullata]MBB6381368.1 signal transduction histidine kinase [Brevundimonas bullata]
MSQYDAKGLLSAVAAELDDIRAGVDEAGGLVSELLRLAPAEQRLTFLTRMQAFDVLSQRVDALAGLASALSEDQPMDTALAALPLAEMADRLRELSFRGRPLSEPAPAAVAGDLLLFD